jgi:hypothetical protein
MKWPKMYTMARLRRMKRPASTRGTEPATSVPKTSRRTMIMIGIVIESPCARSFSLWSWKS